MKIQLFIIALLGFVLTSCSDDPLSKSIVGTWELQSVEITGCDDAEENLPLTTVDQNGCITIPDVTVCNVFYTFAADLTAVQTLTEESGVDSEELSYTVNDEDDTVLLCDIPTDCQTALVDGDLMTFTIQDQECTAVLIYEKA